MATRDHTVDGAEITPAPRTLTLGVQPKWFTPDPGQFRVEINKKALGALSADLETQIKAIASADEADLARLQELDAKLASRFGPALGILN